MQVPGKGEVSSTSWGLKTPLVGLECVVLPPPRAPGPRSQHPYPSCLWVWAPAQHSPSAFCLWTTSVPLLRVPGEPLLRALLAPQVPPAQTRAPRRTPASSLP